MICLFMTFTEKDRQILCILNRDARCSMSEIAEEIGASRSTVFNCLDRLNRNNIINKYTCLVNFSKLGYPIYVKCLVKVKSEDRHNLIQELVGCFHSNNVIKLANDYDVMVSFAFESMDKLHTYLDKLRDRYNILRCEIFYVASDLKREQILSRHSDKVGENIRQNDI